MSPEPEPERPVTPAPSKSAHLCPRDGWPLVTGYRAGLDEGDVEPTGICTRPSCDYFY